MGNGVRQGLNFSEFSRLTVFEPPIEIQDKVTQYLDTATAEVDKIISDIQTDVYKRQIYSFKQGAAIGDKIIIDAAYDLGETSKRYSLKELKYFLEDYNGIKLYRDIFRIDVYKRQT